MREEKCIPDVEQKPETDRQADGETDMCSSARARTHTYTHTHTHTLGVGATGESRALYKSLGPRLTYSLYLWTVYSRE